MAVRYNKNNLPNELYFATFTILGWRNIFVKNKYCSLVYKWFDYLKDNYSNEICGYVIMPNHVHVLIKLSDKSPLLPKIIQNAKRFLAYQIIKLAEEDNRLDLLNFFSMNAKKKGGAKHKVFEDSYDSLMIQSNKFFLEKLNYIHSNPCQEKWHLASDPEDYKYSSASNYILGKGEYEVCAIDF